jgi:hypothetical protein
MDSSSSTSCHRFGWRDPATFVCASSSTRINVGFLASAASRSNSSSFGMPGAAGERRGRISRPASCAAVSARPWVSMTPATTSVPALFRARAARSIA